MVVGAPATDWSKTSVHIAVVVPCVQVGPPAGAVHAVNVEGGVVVASGVAVSVSVSADVSRAKVFMQVPVLAVHEKSGMAAVSETVPVPVPPVATATVM